MSLAVGRTYETLGERCPVAPLLTTPHKPLQKTSVEESVVDNLLLIYNHHTILSVSIDTRALVINGHKLYFF